MKIQNEDILVDIAAYCIMDNHVHLLLKSDLDNLSKFIIKINTKYAMKYNYIYDRIGHVFQDRYKSEAIHDEIYLLNVVRYIHNNPVRAKIVKLPNEYKWSSYNEFLTSNEFICKNQKELLFNIFGSVNKFIDFHKIEDKNECLDTKEDIEELRLETAQLLISNYFKDNGINHIDEIKNQFCHYESMVKILIGSTNLSNRQIATLIGIDKGIVNTIKKQIVMETGVSLSG
jgi:REP element-mobilizing transposase RayT